MNREFSILPIFITTETLILTDFRHFGNGIKEKKFTNIDKHPFRHGKHYKVIENCSCGRFSEE